MNYFKKIKVLTLTVFSLLFFLACGKEENVLHMATKPMTEQYIIADIVKILVEQDTNLKIEVSAGIGGGTLNIQPAMLKGDFDFYPEYTGTGWNAVLKKDSLYQETLFNELQQGYNKMGLVWLNRIGFNNTYGIMIRRELAEQYSLKTYSDLKKVAPQLIFGANYDFFERPDGFEYLTKAYGLEFKKTVDLDIGLKYDAIEQKKIDISTIFTTDGQLSTADVVVLEDDKDIYPSYQCAFVFRKESLEAHPEIAKVLDKIKITDAEMAEMNYQVEKEHKNSEDVARQFLKKKHLLK